LKSPISDLHDYTLTACSLDQSDWMMIFDIGDPDNSVRQDFHGVQRWVASSVRSPIGVLELVFWDISKSLVQDAIAMESWRRVFGFICDDEEMFRHSINLFAQNVNKFLVSIQTVDNGHLDLICDELTQQVY